MRLGSVLVGKLTGRPCSCRVECRALSSQGHTCCIQHANNQWAAFRGPRSSEPGLKQLLRYKGSNLWCNVYTWPLEVWYQEPDAKTCPAHSNLIKLESFIYWSTIQQYRVFVWQKMRPLAMEFQRGSSSTFQRAFKNQTELVYNEVCKNSGTTLTGIPAAHFANILPKIEAKESIGCISV